MADADGERDIAVKVVTRSSRPRVEEAEEGSLKVYVSSAPEKGKANAQVISAVARHIGVRRSRLKIVRGETSRDKVIRIFA